jgi:hypothetical protein
MNATVIRTETTNKTFKRKMSFPILTIALWALLIYAGFKIVWNYSSPSGQKSVPAKTAPVKNS